MEPSFFFFCHGTISDWETRFIGHHSFPWIITDDNPPSHSDIFSALSTILWHHLLITIFVVRIKFVCECVCECRRKVPDLYKLCISAYYYHIGVELFSGFVMRSLSSKLFLLPKDMQQFFWPISTYKKSILFFPSFLLLLTGTFFFYFLWHYHTRWG